VDHLLPRPEIIDQEVRGFMRGRQSLLLRRFGIADENEATAAMRDQATAQIAPVVW